MWNTHKFPCWAGLVKNREIYSCSENFYWNFLHTVWMQLNLRVLANFAKRENYRSIGCFLFRSDGSISTCLSFPIHQSSLNALSDLSSMIVTVFRICCIYFDQFFICFDSWDKQLLIFKGDPQYFKCLRRELLRHSCVEDHFLPTYLSLCRSNLVYTLVPAGAAKHREMENMKNEANPLIWIIVEGWCVFVSSAAIIIQYFILILTGWQVLIHIVYPNCGFSRFYMFYRGTYILIYWKKRPTYHGWLFYCLSHHSYILLSSHIQRSTFSHDFLALLDFLFDFYVSHSKTNKELIRCTS